MAIEIERKFLLKNSDWRGLVRSEQHIAQGYLNSDMNRVVRVRVIGEKGVLTIKGKSVGNARPEYEYEIPHTDALALIAICEQPVIEKTRYEVEANGHLWEIDEFKGENEGLIVAEVELKSETETVQLPSWIGEEVSNDPRYFNVALIKQPFSTWEAKG